MGYGCNGKYYWSMDSIPDWDIIHIELPSAFRAFVQEGQKLFNIRNNTQLQYITKASLDRYELLFTELMKALSEKNKCCQSVPMKQWIILGAVTEVTLQIILAVYYSDYVNERWQQWDGFDVDYIKSTLSTVLEHEVETKKLTMKQKKSIMSAVSDKIKEHTSEHPIDRIMLDELIQFAGKTKLLLNDCLLEQLKIIQSNRNCIHAFTQRTIDDWNTLRFSVNALGFILDDFGYRFEAENSQS